MHPRFRMSIPCRYCKGTTRIRYTMRGQTYEHECTSCNRTGIDGDPGVGLVVVIVFLLIFIGVLVWAL